MPDVDALRRDALSATFAVMGVPATITRPAPDNTPIATSVIWLPPPVDEPRPAGTDFQRLAPRKVIGVRVTATLPSLPRGTTILAAAETGGTQKTWRVEDIAKPAELDLTRVLVVEV